MTGFSSGKTYIDSADLGKLPVLNKIEDSIHRGRHFFIETYSTLSNLEEVWIKITASAAKDTHMKLQTNSTNELKLELFEEPTGGMTGGTGLTAFNSDRNSATTAETVIVEGTIAPTSNGTLLYDSYLGVASNPNNFIGGENFQDNELALKSGAIYILHLTSYAAGNIVNYRIIWHED